MSLLFLYILYLPSNLLGKSMVVKGERVSADLCWPFVTVTWFKLAWIKSFLLACYQGVVLSKAGGQKFKCQLLKLDPRWRHLCSSFRLLGKVVVDNLLAWPRSGINLFLTPNTNRHSYTKSSDKRICPPWDSIDKDLMALPCFWAPASHLRKCSLHISDLSGLSAWNSVDHRMPEQSMGMVQATRLPTGPWNAMNIMNCSKSNNTDWLTGQRMAFLFNF